ncbi:dTMP kinase [Candidatus Saccharibacteria bacterium]|nr:dTMP kinase [Candidatus Saccharibacteria bacterium]
MAERGKYIVIEGHDGTGKSTQVEMLHKRLSKEGVEAVEIHEPAGVAIADELRKIIKNGELDRDGETNLLLFTAARRELFRQVIAPTLGRGAWVLAARNWRSTAAYQGYGEGLDIDEIETITRQYTDEAYLNPDFECFLSLQSKQERTKRIAKRGELENPDTFESRDDDFQAKVENGYLDIAEKDGLLVIDASPSPEEIHEEIWKQIQEIK